MVGLSSGRSNWRFSSKPKRAPTTRRRSIIRSYYGFFGVTLAWQLLFLVIGLDPVRYRMAMLPALVEKGSFALAIPILYALGRVPGLWLIFASMDGTWLVLFATAFVLTPKDKQQVQEEKSSGVAKK